MSITSRLDYIFLSSAVRFGYRPDDARVLARFLQACDEEADGLPTRQLVEHWENAFYLLLETYCDSIVPARWRNQCLVAAKQVLIKLATLSGLDDDVRLVSRCRETLVAYTRYLGATDPTVASVPAWARHRAGLGGYEG